MLLSPFRALLVYSWQPFLRDIRLLQCERLAGQTCERVVGMCFRICVPSVSLTCEKLHLRTYIPACTHLLLVRFRTYSGKESKAQYTYEYSETCSDVRTVFRMWV